MTLCIAWSAGYALGGRESAHWAKQKESEVQKNSPGSAKRPLSAIALRQERSAGCVGADDESLGLTLAGCPKPNCCLADPYAMNSARSNETTLCHRFGRLPSLPRH